MQIPSGAPTFLKDIPPHELYPDNNQYHYSGRLNLHNAAMFFISLGVLVTALFGIRSLGKIVSSLSDIRAIESEVRDANWIMACDDADAKTFPETYAACHLPATTTK